MEQEKKSTQIRCMAFPAPNNEGSKWWAVALEMDIWGFGNTTEAAMEDLNELIAIQIEFAAGKNKISILDHPAEKKWFQLWDILKKWEEEEQQNNNSVFSGKMQLANHQHLFDKAILYHQAA